MSLPVHTEACLTVNETLSVGIRLVTQDTTFFADEMLINQLLTHDPTIDLYLIEGSFVSLKPVIDKSFAFPLSDERLTSTLSSMFPAVQTAVSRNGVYYAVPFAVSSDGCSLFYHEETYRQFCEEGYTLPASWEELMDQLADCQNDWWSLGAEPLGMNEEQILEQTMKLYTAREIAYGRKVDYSARDFVALVEKTMRAIRQLQKPPSQWEECLLHRNTVSPFKDEHQGIHAIVLPLCSGEEAVLPIRLSVLFINPYSTKKNWRKAF